MIKTKLMLACLPVILFTPLSAAVGDKSPSVPSTYVAAHPRLGAPTTTYLNTIWAARPTAYGGTNGATRIWNAADAWNSAAPVSGRPGIVNCRYLVMSYLAEKANSGPRTAAYLTKIKSLSSTVDTMGSWVGGWCSAIAYDWTYSDLDITSQSNYRTKMYTMMSLFEQNQSGFSPLNDQFYITGNSQTPHLILALAIYPDDAATSLPHLRWSMDMWLNYMLPAWKMVMTGNSGCGASSDADTGCGAGWHESWEYTNNTNTDLGLTHWIAPYALAWKNASGVSDFFSTNGWLKNWSYYTMYMTRPDWRFDLIGLTSYGIPTSEFGNTSYIVPASIPLLAEIFNDPTIRGWSRLFNGTGTPDGFEPSGWPWYDPDTSAKSTNSRSVLSKVKNFPGWGTVFFRTGWTEDDTVCWLRYGDNFWSHPVQDSGGWACYSRGELALRSGTYRAGTNSPHMTEWVSQAISENSILINDSGDIYAGETYTVNDATGPHSVAIPNDGGQRRVGSDLSNAGGEMQKATNVPLDIAQWQRSREIYKNGDLVTFVVPASRKYAYAAIDITRAYNNLYSAGAHTVNWALREANTVNRSMRVSKVIRHMLFIPRSAAAYVVMYDQVTSTNASFSKNNLIHLVNSPTTSAYAGGQKWIVARTQTVTGIINGGEWPYPFLSNLTYASGNFQYIYNGKMYGWMTLPSGGSLTAVGGSGSEFLIGATNYNHCSNAAQCPADQFGVDAEVHPQVTNWTSDLGSYRIVEAPGAASKEDWFLNVMLFTTNSDINTVTIGNEPSTSLVGTNYVTTWKDNSNNCTYTVTFPKYGTGGQVTATGSGCASTI